MNKAMEDDTYPPDGLKQTVKVDGYRYRLIGGKDDRELLDNRNCCILWSWIMFLIGASFVVAGLVLIAMLPPPSERHSHGRACIDSAESTFTALSAHYKAARQSDRLPVFTVYNNDYVSRGQLATNIEMMRIDLCRLIESGPVVVEIADAREIIQESDTLAIGMFYRDRAYCIDDYSRLCPTTIADMIIQPDMDKFHLSE